MFCSDFKARKVLKIKRGWSSSYFGGNSGNYGGCGVKCGLKKNLNAQTSEVGLVSRQRTRVNGHVSYIFPRLRSARQTWKDVMHKPVDRLTSK